MALLNFFRRKRISLQDPVLGLITLEKGKGGPYWMHDAYEADELAVSIDTVGHARPTEAQAVFFNKITDDPDSAFGRVAELLVPCYEEFTGRPFPRFWRHALKLCGVGVPLHGQDMHPWDVSFACLTDDSGHIFTCHFVDGRPARVSLDG